jgi:ATP sulfurylase
MLNNQKLFSLINVANVESGLLAKNLVRGHEELMNFRCMSSGVPILIPADPSLFIYKKSDVFAIEPEEILEIIYGHNDSLYVGFAHSFRDLTFLSNFEVKDEYRSTVSAMINQNDSVVDHVSRLRLQGKTIGAFQTRNIPHFGHEKIIHRMLDHCDHLVINPVFGPKKSGDATLQCLENVFSNFYHNQFSGRITFKPIMANMFYAGPREAIHHSRMRKKLGFDLFSVGRDHAGASGIYAPDAAVNAVKRFSRILGINVFCHSGAVFCRSCDRVILRDDCEHADEDKMDISGTQFRHCLNSKTLFEFASSRLQEYLFSQNFQVFEDD